MGNKIPILTNSTNQLLLITKILIEYNLQDLKWKILYLIPETDDTIEDWLFIQNYLEKIPEMYWQSQQESIKPTTNIDDFEIVKNPVNFKNMTSFKSYFDVCMFTCTLYSEILCEIFSRPCIERNKIPLNFADIYKNIIEDGDNFKFVSGIIEINIIYYNKPCKVIIELGHYDVLHDDFVGLFDKYSKLLKHSKDYTKLVIEFDNMARDYLLNNNIYTIHFAHKKN